VSTGIKGTLNIFNTTLDVMVKTQVEHPLELEKYEKCINSVKDILNSVYLKHPTKEAIISCLTEALYSLEHSLLSVTSGAYPSAHDQLRKVLELFVLGIFFDKDNAKFLSWLGGASEFSFKPKVKLFFTYPEVVRWNSLTGYTGLLNDTITVFGKLSSYTHSHPTSWAQGARDTWKMVYSKNEFDAWFAASLEVLRLSCTFLLLYLPDTMDEPYERVADHNLVNQIITLMA